MEKSISLTENNSNNQQIVTLPILKNCLEQILDKEKAARIMNKNPALQQEIQQLLFKMKSNDFDLNAAAQNDILLLFVSQPDSLHIFRELNGYKIVTDPDYNVPAFNWALMLTRSCENVPENV